MFPGCFQNSVKRRHRLSIYRAEIELYHPDRGTQLLDSAAGYHALRHAELLLVGGVIPFLKIRDIEAVNAQKHVFFHGVTPP